MADLKEIKAKIDDLVSDLAGCDRSGCRCWQACDDLRQIANYALGELCSSIHASDVRAHAGEERDAKS